MMTQRIAMMPRITRLPQVNDLILPLDGRHCEFELVRMVAFLPGITKNHIVSECRCRSILTGNPFRHD